MALCNVVGLKRKRKNKGRLCCQGADLSIGKSVYVNIL